MHIPSVKAQTPSLPSTSQLGSAAHARPRGAHSSSTAVDVGVDVDTAAIVWFCKVSNCKLTKNKTVTKIKEKKKNKNLLKI